MKDLTELRKIAEEATPGPWEVCNVTEMDADGVTDLAHVLASELETEESVSAVAVSVIRHDATHIATFDPPTVLALITRLEQAEQAVARVREVVGHLKEVKLDCILLTHLDRALDGESNE